MKVHVLFGIRQERYDGECGPEVLLAIDEFCREENPQGWDEDVVKTRARFKNDMRAMRVIDIEVEDARIRDLLLQDPVVIGVSGHKESEMLTELANAAQMMLDHDPADPTDDGCRSALEDVLRSTRAVLGLP